MLKKWNQLLGTQQNTNRDFRRENGLHNKSPDLSLRPKVNCTRDTLVRVIYPGGREDLYKHEVLASQVMKNYPGTSVARPEVFKDPHKALLSPEEHLLPGQKYYIIPSSTAQKLKRNHSEKGRVEEPDGVTREQNMASSSVDNLEASFRSAKDYYVSKERWSKGSKRRGIKGKKPFVPPLPGARILRGLGWEPSLSPIQELSA